MLRTGVNECLSEVVGSNIYEKVGARDSRCEVSEITFEGEKVINTCAPQDAT